MIVGKRAAWSAVAAGAAMLGGTVVQRGLHQAWKLAKHEDPPLDPTSRDVTWRDAIIWTIASGVLFGLGSLIARRGAAAGWERFTGEAPPS